MTAAEYIVCVENPSKVNVVAPDPGLIERRVHASMHLSLAPPARACAANRLIAEWINGHLFLTCLKVAVGMSGNRSKWARGAGLREVGRSDREMH
jgi:hypothetical protein